MCVLVEGGVSLGVALRFPKPTPFPRPQCQACCHASHPNCHEVTLWIKNLLIFSFFGNKSLVTYRQALMWRNCLYFLIFDLQWLFYKIQTIDLLNSGKAGQQAVSILEYILPPSGQKHTLHKEWQKQTKAGRESDQDACGKSFVCVQWRLSTTCNHSLNCIAHSERQGRFLPYLFLK